MRETVHKAFKRGISVSYSTLSPLDVGFLSQTFWGLVSLVQIPGVRMPDIEHQSLAPPPPRETPDWWEPSLLPCRGEVCFFFFSSLFLCISYLSRCDLFILFWEKAVYLFFRSFSEGNGLCSCRFGVYVGGGEFTIFLCHQLAEVSTFCVLLFLGYIRS